MGHDPLAATQRSACLREDAQHHHSASEFAAHFEPSMTAVEPFEETTLDPAHPREWHAPVAALSGKVYRQLLGLNPFKTSYLSLYSSLDSAQDKAVACGGVLFAIAAGVPLPIIGVIFGRLISSFPPNENELRTRISELLGVAVAYFVVTALYATAFGFTSEKISIRIRHRLLQCLLHLDQAYLDTHEIDVNSLLTEKIDTIHAGCSEKIGIFIQSISYFVAAFIVGFILSPKLAGILLSAVIPALALVVSLTSTSISRLSKRASEHKETANGVVESALRAIKVVQAFDMMAEICAKHMECLDATSKTGMRKAIVSAVQVGAIFFLMYAVNGLAFYVGSRMALSGQQGDGAGTVFAVVFLVMDSSLVVAQFAPLIDIFARAASAKEAVQELLDARTTAEAAKECRSTLQRCEVRGCQVKFEGVTFAYPSRPSVNALSALDLTVRPGTFTAVVGTSGGGKSTLVSLLTRTYEYCGRINIGSNELRTLDVDDFRAQLAVVEQEPALFPGTVRENICNGVVTQGISGDELELRCRQAVSDAAVDFLDRLPNGLDTHLGNGLQLSGGQRQRICLARALIRRPAILILDEPTAALDARSEVMVVEAVKKAAVAGTTVIMVAHRLSTILEADHVAVFCDGSVAEQGKPQDLSETGGVFRSLLDAQSTDMARSLANLSKEDLLEKDDAFESSASVSENNDKAQMDQTVSTEKAQTAISTRRVLAQIGSIVGPDGYVIVIGLIASIISGALLLGEAIIFGHLIQLLNVGVGQPNFEQQADFFCLMFFILACVALVSWVCSGTAFGIASTHSVARIQTQLLNRLLYLDMQWFSLPGRTVHHLMSAFTKDSGDLSCLSGPALGTIFTTTTSVVGGIILALIVAWKIAVVLLAAVPVMLAAGFTRLRVLGSADARRRTAYQSATSFAAEACRNRRTVTVFGLEAHVLEQYHDKLHEPWKRARLFTVVSNILLAASFAVTYFVYALAYWWGSKQVRNGNYSGLQFFIVLPALLFSAQASGQLFSLSPEIARAKAAATSVLRLLNHHPKILTDVSATDEKFSAMPTAHSLGSLASTSVPEPVPKFSFERVSLSYSGNKSQAVLREVNISVPTGHTIALVGPSGAGKSSAIALMERFYDPSAGCVRLDGVDLRDLDLKRLRDRIGLVSQEPDLLPGSVAENIKLGAGSQQSVSDADVERACKQVGLHDFITSLPDGYNTDCGSNGSSKLSGGQRQRLALARALIRNPDILLLDEPTSALDAHSEAYVKEALAEAAEGRTTIIVAHRLASIQHADRIYVFDQGFVVEEGAHAELIGRGGLYASMAKAQSLS